MRNYECKSPEAAGRILAACLISDGHLSIAELEALDRCGLQKRLLLNRNRLLSIVQSLYEDLARCGYMSWNDVCHVDPETLAWLAADVQDRRLRKDIIELCNEALVAEDDFCEREAAFMKALCEAWEITRQ